MSTFDKIEQRLNKRWMHVCAYVFERGSTEGERERQKHIAYYMLREKVTISSLLVSLLYFPNAIWENALYRL